MPKFVFDTPKTRPPITQAKAKQIVIESDTLQVDYVEGTDTQDLRSTIVVIRRDELSRGDLGKVEAAERLLLQVAAGKQRDEGTVEK